MAKMYAIKSNLPIFTPWQAILCIPTPGYATIFIWLPFPGRYLCGRTVGSTDAKSLPMTSDITKPLSRTLSIAKLPAGSVSAGLKVIYDSVSGSMGTVDARRAHPLGLPLSALLDSVLSNILLPAWCSWCAEFCMRGCNIWSANEKERSCWRDGRGIGEIGEKMGEKMGGKMGKEW
jgi:hypothetical protein